jgi:sarcosine reductase
MKLEIQTCKVTDASFGPKTCLCGGKLELSAEALKSHLLEDPIFEDAWIELVKPGEDTRIIHVADVLEPRLKLAGGTAYAGTAAPVSKLGWGITRAMEGVTVMTSCQFPLRRHGGLNVVRDAALDMSGPASGLTPFSGKINIVCCLKLKPDLDEDQYEESVRLAGAKAARFVGEAMRDAEPSENRTFTLEGAKPDLPNVALLYQVHAVGLNLNSFFYGMPFSGLLPILVHPNEILDGALVDGNWSHPAVKTPTWFHTNSRLVHELYDRHGKTLNFVGFVLYRGRFEEMQGKARCANQVVNTAQMLHADGAVVSWEGAGNAFIETMLVVKGCEQAGIKAALLTFEHGGLNGVDEPLFYSEAEANAIVSSGTYEREIVLPPVSRVVGGDLFVINPEEGGIPLDAKGAIELHDRLQLYCAANEYGFTKNSCADY